MRSDEQVAYGANGHTTGQRGILHMNHVQFMLITNNSRHSERRHCKQKRKKRVLFEQLKIMVIWRKCVRKKGSGQATCGKSTIRVCRVIRIWCDAHTYLWPLPAPNTYSVRLVAVDRAYQLVPNWSSAKTPTKTMCQSWQICPTHTLILPAFRHRRHLGWLSVAS